MNNQAQDLYKLSQEGASKFDYFICSAAGALLAYLAQTSTFGKLNTISSILQTCGILVLAISFYSGIRRIQYSNALWRYNHTMLDGSERAAKIAVMLATNPQNEFPNEGKIETRKEVEAKRQSYLLASVAAEKLMNKAGKKVAIHGKIQLYFLFLGFFAVVSSKLTQPYEPNLSERLFSIF